MGNEASREKSESEGSNKDDGFDFEPVDKPASPTFMRVTIAAPNDLSTSGVLVDLKEEEKEVLKRRIVQSDAPEASGASPLILSSSTVPDTPLNRKKVVPSTAFETDDDILKASMEQDKNKRLSKLQNDQKARRTKAVEERRKLPAAPTSSAQPNPFSQFLSAFSVQPKYPSHKRGYEAEDTPEEDDDVAPVEAKRPKLDEEKSDGPKSLGKKFTDVTSELLGWLDETVPGWPYWSVATVAVTWIVWRSTSARR
eukprot:Nitzschia sp. Nitz4//scaffold109_size72162//51584//52345//NITZ4_005853-RA/size72162-processed-gene-0.18-mRNA-1//1//CDS//3329532784//1222//frame0